MAASGRPHEPLRWRPGEKRRREIPMTEAREERLKAALRENLRKRKKQARERASTASAPKGTPAEDRPPGDEPPSNTGDS
jgi:hypothetical protein